MGRVSPALHLARLPTSPHTPVTMAAKPDPYANIDFDEICEATGLAVDEIKCLKTCFDLFDTKKVDFLSADDLGEIMRAMGFRPTEEELKDLLAEIDEDGSGEIEFAEFCRLCATFLVEDPDMETMKRELKDAFGIYDKEGLGYITTETLRGLIGELLAPLSDEELEGILEELDEDGSGSMDFDEFCEMMMTKPEYTMMRIKHIYISMYTFHSSII